MNNYKTPFCFAPWTHTYLSPQGERRLCCASREQAHFTQQYLDRSSELSTSFSPMNIDEYWNSPHLKSIRKQMLAGEIPQECIVCKTQELTLQTYRSYFTHDLFPHLKDTILSSTAPTGETTMKPRSFDYRISNQCNFKCRMCGPQLSSSWEQEQEHTARWQDPEIKQQINNFISNTAQTEFSNALTKGEIEEIYWVGGEPLTWNFHWHMMQLAIKNNTAKHIFCRYNTNLSILDFEGSNLVTDILPHFKGYLIAASIDATGDVGEYLRSGLNWKKWKQNFKTVLDATLSNKKQEIYLDVTLTLPGLLYLEDMIDFANKHRVAIIPKLVYSFDASILLSPLALPKEILHPILQEKITYCFKNLSPHTTQLLQLLNNLKKRLSHNEKYKNWQQAEQQGKQYLIKLETIRNCNLNLQQIFSKYPQVLQWWESL